MKYSAKKVAIGTFLFFLLYSILHGQEAKEAKNYLPLDVLKNKYVIEQISSQYARKALKKEDSEKKSENTKNINAILSGFFKENFDLFNINATSNSLNLKKNIGKATLEATATDGSTDTYGLAAKLGGAYFTIDPKSGSYVAGQKLGFGKNTVNISYNSATKLASLQGNINFKSLKAAVNISDVLNPENIFVQANLNLEGVVSYIQYCNQLGKQSTFLGAEYSIDGIRFQINAQISNSQKDLSMALKFLEALSIAYGKDKVMATLQFKI